MVLSEIWTHYNELEGMGKKNIMLCRKIIICIVQWKVFLFQLVFRKYLEKLLKGPRQT